MSCFRVKVGSSDHLCIADEAHCKASLVEVVDVVSYNAILGYGLLETLEPFYNSQSILAFRPLVVILSKVLGVNIWISFNKFVNPMEADSWFGSIAATGQENHRHFANLGFLQRRASFVHG